jgi:hypothetical protein
MIVHARTLREKLIFSDEPIGVVQVGQDILVEFMNINC